jgi:hypothetical protein
MNIPQLSPIMFRTIQDDMSSTLAEILLALTYPSALVMLERSGQLHNFLTSLLLLQPLRRQFEATAISSLASFL